MAVVQEVLEVLQQLPQSRHQTDDQNEGDQLAKERAHGSSVTDNGEVGWDPGVPLTLMLLLLLSCATPVVTAGVSDENAATAKVLVEEVSHLLILDVRSPGEFKAGHLKGAVNINVADDNFAKRVKSELDSSKPVLVHCQAGAPGGRSRKAVPVLQEAGFQTIHHLDGGYAAWASAGNLVVE
jgi:rhodanese-related sulfurtransferase